MNIKHSIFCTMLVFGLIVTSCQNKNKVNNETAVESPDSILNDGSNPKTLGTEQVPASPKTLGIEEVPGERSQTTEGISTEIAQEVITHYLELKNALVKSDNQKAAEIAGKIKKVLGKNQNKLAKNILFEVEQIALIDNAEHQRDRFKLLSEHIYTLVNTTKANETTLYRQYCPMAFDNEGAYWLSAEKEIRNPYFGDKMLKCGSIKETIDN